MSDGIDAHAWSITPTRDMRGVRRMFHWKLNRAERLGMRDGGERCGERHCREVWPWLRRGPSTVSKRNMAKSIDEGVLTLAQHIALTHCSPTCGSHVVQSNTCRRGSQGASRYVDGASRPAVCWRRVGSALHMYECALGWVGSRCSGEGIQA